MTNKEIKFELAKVALTKCNFMTNESLTESMRNLYEWIAEEPDIATKECTQDERSNIHIGEILTHVKNNTSTCSGITEHLSTIFHANNITTVGDLLKIGRVCFKKYRNVGKKSLLALDDALLELGIKGW